MIITFIKSPALFHVSCVRQRDIQTFVTGRPEDLPGEFCGDEAGEQRGEKLKLGWMG